PQWGYSHLVTYEQGTSFMTEQMGDRTQMSLIYSPKWWLGVGLMYDRETTQDFKGDVYSAMVSVLLKRWNLEKAQGNLYTFIAPGFLQNRLESESKGDHGVFKYGLRADYETRRFYVAAEYMEVLSFKPNLADNKMLNNLMFAMGVAPFLANYDDLNIWFL